jgi:hypothetical protein
MSYRTKAVAAAMLSLASFVPMSFASAADLPVKVKAKPVPDLPFFLVIDDRVTFSYIGRGTNPGYYSVNPANGTANGNTAKSVYSFTHFDVWAYGTNFFSINMFKADHNAPAAPCTNTGVIQSATVGGFASPAVAAQCAGYTEFFGLLRSTYGWNEIFNTKAFSYGPLHNISFEIGAEGEADNSTLAPNKRAFEAGLQFAFDLPYKGYFNVAPLAYRELNHNAFNQCGSAFAAGAIAGVNCNLDGTTNFKTTWAVEINYYMDLGFLPESINYFAISGRAGWYGAKGDANGLPLASGPGVLSTATKTELNSEPIRLTFDASKAFWGPKYAQFVTTWVSYRYWQNKFGLDHNAELGVCQVGTVAAHISTNTCTESSYQAGITVKF